MPASTTPHRVTDDPDVCAEAAPTKAIAARATRDFFISRFSKVEQKAPVREKAWSRFPGPTSFWEVVAIAPDSDARGKENHRKTAPESPLRCNGTTIGRTPWNPRNSPGVTAPALNCFQPRTPALDWRTSTGANQQQPKH